MHDVIHKGVIGVMPLIPRPVMWRFSKRYIAGTSLQDARRTVSELNAAGCTATVDVLGEDSIRVDQIEAARDLYVRALDGIGKDSLACNISVKLSEMGLRLDPDHCRRVMRSLLQHAATLRNFVRIDMEDSTVTTITLDIYRELRNEFDNVGTVIQSCLRRSSDDVADLLAGGPTNIRLCKGIYIEPEEIAWHDADAIRDSFKSLLVQLFEGGAQRVGIATHDPALVEHARETISRLAVPKKAYEFQMLLGVAGSLRRELVAQGHPLRVYVPFGELWYSYSMRRLRENPNIVGHIIGNLFRAG